ncbi:hypothetical protein SEEN447_15343, partial [Salmonella enterica subsp. enterica serovar Newport str. CVM 19447]
MCWVYPRWRREHEPLLFLDIEHRGLSPLARGTQPLRLYERRFLRFIPAGAGNTGISGVGATSETVYPRWRGEHRQNCTSRPCPYGLSPLARGTPSPEFCPATTTRFIPAGAGNTIDTSTGWPFFTVYPPLARGTL